MTAGSTTRPDERSVMDPERHERFTRELTRWAEDTDDVVGLVGVGSTAGTDRQPDRWSDHDILIVTRPGAAEGLRRSTAWLPDAQRIVLAFDEPDHGLTAIYDDGHLIEAAVAEINDVGWFRADAYRVLVIGAGRVPRAREGAGDRRQPAGPW